MSEIKLLPRKALLNRLTSAFGKRVSVLLGPAGSGKTTLVKQWLDSHISDDSLVVWFRIPDGILSNIVLLQYFLNAWNAFIPVSYFRKQLDNSTRTVIKSMGGYLRSNLRKPFVLVIDDVHNLPDYLRDWFFQDLIAEFPPSARFIFLSRVLPTLDHIRLSAGDELSVVMEDLNFRETEVYDLADTFGLSGDSRGFVESVWQQFKGWPIATVTALESGVQDISHLREDLFANLFAGVLGRMQLSERNLLLDMAIFDQVNFYLLQEILDSDLSESSFLGFVSKGYFFREGQEWYRMHDVFRDYCLRELKVSDPRRESFVRTRLARYYLKKAQFAQAFEQFLKADLFEELAEILEFNIWMLGVSANAGLLKAFTQKLADHPDFVMILLRSRIQVLLSIFALLNQTRMFDEVLRLAELCRKLNLPDLSFYADIWIKGNVMWVYFSTGDTAKAEVIATEILELELKEDWHLGFTSESDRLFGVDKSAFLVLNYIRQDLVAINGLFKRVLASVDSKFHEYSTNVISMTLTNSLAVSLMVGEKVELAEPRIKYLMDVADRYPRSFLGFFVIDNLVPYFIQLGDFERAGLLLEPYLEWDLGKGMKAVVLSHYTVVLLNSGYFQDAYRHARHCFDLIGPERSGQAEAQDYVADLAELAYYLGNRDEYLEWLKIQEENANRSESELGIYQTKLLRLFYSLEAWNWSGIQQQFLNYKAEILSKDLSLKRFTLKTFEFFLAYYRHDLRLGETLLEQIEVETNDEVIRWFARQLVVRDVDYSLFKDFRRISAAFHWFSIRYGASKARHFVRPFRRLELSLLGSEVLRLEGKYLDTNYWCSSQNRFVFYYLVFVGAADSTQLISVFWPNKTDDKAGNALRKAVSWVRGVLGKSAVHHEDGMYSVGLDLRIDCDIFDLRNFAKLPGLDIAPVDGASVIGTATMERYVSGGFVLKEDYAWLQDLRFEVSGLQGELLKKFIGMMRERGLVHNVLYILDRFRRQNLFEEEFWWWSFECLAELGEMAKLAFLYKEMLDIFNRELGVLPSEETRDLYQKLVVDV